MKTAILAFSSSGRDTGRKIKEYIESSGLGEATLQWKSRFCDGSIRCSHTEWTGKRFQDSDAIIFVCSCGIAVRSIAPFIKSKTEDPAVLVIDDLGLHCISLLSGHIGGANELAVKISEAIGAQPVITTASDIRDRIAPDVFAVKNGLVIDDMTICRNYAADRLENRDSMRMEITPFVHEGRKEDVLWLIPRWTYVGIGCRKDIDTETIETVFEEAVFRAGIDRRSIRGIASIDVKKREKGLLSFCRKEGYTIDFFSAEELKSVPGDFSESDFVRETVGTGNVCERSSIALAVKLGKQGKNPYLVLKKFGKEGVTVAIAVREEELEYE